MKGDFSRVQGRTDANPAGAGLSALWLQQGRPLLDADFNQAMEIHRQHLANALASLIGGPAGPAADLGFAVTPVCALALNDPPSSGRQCLFLPAPGIAAPPPHTVEAELVTFGDEDDLVLAVSLDDPPPQAAGPETLQLTLRAPDKAEGPILVRPGAYTVRLRADRSVVLERPGVAEPVGLGTLAADGWTDLLVAEAHRHLHLRLGAGKTVTMPITPVLLRGGAAFAIAADDPAAVRQATPALLCCHLATLRRWSSAMDLDRLAARLAGGTVPRRHLVLDLDPTRISADGTNTGGGAAHMQSRPPGHGHAALAWTGDAPRLVLERYDLSAGSYVVDGLSVRATTTMAADAQPFLPDPVAAAASGPGTWLVYLDLWDRGVDALEDPALADPALLGVDTVIRGETIWQVRSALVDPVVTAEAAMADLQDAARGALSIWRAPTPAPRQGNGLLRVEIHHPGWTDSAALTAARRTALVDATVQDHASRQISLREGSHTLRPGAPVRVYPAGDASGSGLLTRVEQVAPGTLVLAALPDHLPDGKLRLLPIASFKWSRSNAAASYPVTRVQQAVDDEGNAVAVAMLSSAGLNGFEIRPGDWLELTDREAALMRRPGQFLRVRSLQEDLLRIVLDGWTDPLPFEPAPEAQWRLTTWSQRRYWHVEPGQQAPAADEPWPRPVSPDALEIDPGVWVQFEAEGRYRSGDYWTAPLREESLDVAGWQRGGTEATAQPPQGINHHLAPLALLRLDPWQITADDLRHAFPSLRQLAQHLPQNTNDFIVACADWARHWGLAPPDRSSSPAAVVERMLHLWLSKPAADVLAGLGRWAAAWNLPAPAESLPPTVLIERLLRSGMQATFSTELRLLARPGVRVEGFAPTGETVAISSVEAATWQRLAHHHRRDEMLRPAKDPTLPFGPGQGAMAGLAALFVGGRAGVWACAAPGTTWHRIEALGEAPGAAVAVHGGTVILAGGEGRRRDAVTRIDPIGLTQEPVGRLAVPVSHAASVVIGDTLFILGGVDRHGRKVAEVQAFDLGQPHRHGLFGRRSAEAVVCGRLPSARAHHAAVAWDGAVILAGGEDAHGHALAEVLVINPATSAALSRAALSTPCHSAGVAVVAEGMVLAGGQGQGGTALSDVRLYRPAQDRWITLAPLPVHAHSLALLAEPEAWHADGSRLVALGGRGTDADLEGGHALPLQRTMTVLMPGGSQ
jgi:hypothetical protein